MARRNARRDDAARWRRAISRLRAVRKDGERLAGKPLLTLLLFARAAREADRFVTFREIERPLVALLEAYGPPRDDGGAAGAFWRLQTDGYWVLPSARTLSRPKGGWPSAEVLRTSDGPGEVPKHLWVALATDEELRADLARLLLRAHWPATLHAGIRAGAGLPEPSPAPRPDERPPDPAFHAAVLEAHSGCCAVCGWDARLGGRPLGLEVLHIRWRCAGGREEPSNALALCALHAAAFDGGALGIDADGRLLVSEALEGSALVEASLRSHAGNALPVPPASESAAWHRREVFRAAREGGG